MCVSNISRLRLKEDDLDSGASLICDEDLPVSDSEEEFIESRRFASFTCITECLTQNRFIRGRPVNLFVLKQNSRQQWTVEGPFVSLQIQVRQPEERHLQFFCAQAEGACARREWKNESPSVQVSVVETSEIGSTALHGNHTCTNMQVLQSWRAQDELDSSTGTAFFPERKRQTKRARKHPVYHCSEANISLWNLKSSVFTANQLIMFLFCCERDSVSESEADECATDEGSLGKHLK